MSQAGADSMQRAGDVVRALGAHVLPDSALFRVWSTRAKCLELLTFPRDGASEQFPMDPRGDGLFEVTVPLPPGTLYKFKVDGQPLPDPYARALPEGAHGRA